MIRPARLEDMPAIAAISNASIQTEAANFADTPEDVSVWEERFEAARTHPWFVAEDQAHQVVGFSKSGPFREKAAYSWLAETSVYLAREARGMGLGRALYEPLIDTLRARRFTRALGIIALPNPASVALHEQLGFRKVGHLDRAGWKFERWWDVGFWELALKDETPPPQGLRKT